MYIYMINLPHNMPIEVMNKFNVLVTGVPENITHVQEDPRLRKDLLKIQCSLQYR